MKRFRISIALIVLIFLLGTAIRFIGLGTNPPGIVDDEADEAYDAYSLIHTGKDQWGAAWPITSFRGFGDYRLPGYTYLAIPSIAAFGLTPFAIRIPSALFGSLTILAVYFFVKELFLFTKKPGVTTVVSDIFPLLAAFFLAISPWHIGMSRIALEETTSVFFVTCGVYALLRGREKHAWIILGCVLLGLSLFIYTPNVLLVPFLIFLVFVVFRGDYRGAKKQILFGLIGFFLVASPILISTSTSTAATRTRQVNFTNDQGTIDIINEKQGACSQKIPHTLCRVIINKYSVFGSKFIANYLNHFSPNLLSIYGTPTQYSILPDRGLLYLFDYPLLILAIVTVFLNVTPACIVLIGFLFFAALPDSLTSDGQFARFFISYPVWPILIALGITTILAKAPKRLWIISGIVIIFLAALSSFLVEYWTFFPYRYSRYSHYGYASLIQEIQKNMSSYDRIIVSSRVNDAKQYIYYVFYTAFDPAVFQSGAGIEKVIEANGWVRVKRINALEFLPSIPSASEFIDTRALLIGAPTEFPSKIPTEFTLKDKKGDVWIEAVDARILYPCVGIACHKPAAAL